MQKRPTYIFINFSDLHSGPRLGASDINLSAPKSSGYKERKDYYAKNKISTPHSSGACRLKSQVTCPICNELFPASEISAHSSNCYTQDILLGPSDEEACPICGAKFKRSQLEEHAGPCAQNAFG